MYRTILLTLCLGFSTVAVADPPAPDESLATWAQDREDRLLSIVKEHAPERYTELTALRDTDPVAYVMALHEVARMARAEGAGAERPPGPGMGPASGASKPDQDPQIAALQAQIDTLATGYSALSAAEQKKRYVEIQALAGQVFDLRQAQRKRRLEEMKDRLAGLETEIADRESRRDQLIAQWLDKRLGTPR